jgi:hypothetical protein
MRGERQDGFLAMAQQDNTFSITLKDFHAGFGPLAFSNSLTEIGSAGNASAMANVDVVNGEYLTQGKGLTTLTAGNEAGAVSELIQFIMDKAVANDASYAIGTSKLFKISSTAVTNSAPWPHAITNCTEGESIQVLKGSLFYFYNTASAGNIGKYDLSSTFDDDWGSTVPTGAKALQLAPHPSDKKEDLIVFGNGRYAGVYIAESNTIDPEKLDFGNDATVDDVLYNAGYWLLAVNSGVTGTNRTEGQIYLFDGAALTSTLTDEAGVGLQRIGFLYRINTTVYVAYQDLSSDGFIIGYLNGKSLTPLARFTGTLPTFAQKTLYKNTILFLSSALVWSAGAVVPELPFQLSQLADGGYTTVGAIAAPFGTPIISSTETTHFKLAKFDGYDVNCLWKSLVFSLADGKYKAMIDEIVVLTKALGAGARCDLKIETDQGVTVQTTASQITGTGKTRHFFKDFELPPGGFEDFRIALDWSNGSAANDCAIRKIKINGHFIQST